MKTTSSATARGARGARGICCAVFQVWDSTTWAEAAKLKSGRRAEPKARKQRRGPGARRSALRGGWVDRPGAREAGRSKWFHVKYNRNHPVHQCEWHPVGFISMDYTCGIQQGTILAPREPFLRWDGAGQDSKGTRLNGPGWIRRGSSRTNSI